MNGPVAFFSSGLGMVTAGVSQPPPHLAKSHTEVPEQKSKNLHCQKVPSKHIILLNMCFVSICPVAVKGGCVYDFERNHCRNAGDAGI